MKTYSIRYSVYPYNVEIHVLGFFFFFFSTFGIVSLIVSFFLGVFICFWNSCQSPVGFAGLVVPFHLFLSPVARCLASLVAASRFSRLTEGGHLSFCSLPASAAAGVPFQVCLCWSFVWKAFLRCLQVMNSLHMEETQRLVHKVSCLISVGSSRCQGTQFFPFKCSTFNQQIQKAI